MKVKKGYLIVFEGISASGKSNSIRKLHKFLKYHNYNIKVTSWNSNPFTRKIISFLQQHRILIPAFYSLLQILGFFLDYYFKYHSYLKRDYIVIADRYLHTNIVRDRINGLPSTFSRFITRFFRKPDLLFFIDSHPSLCIKRIKARKKPLLFADRIVAARGAVCNKELNYLKNMRTEYHRLFREKKAGRDFHIIASDADLKKINPLVKNYLIRGCSENFPSQGSEQEVVLVGR